MSLLRKKRLWLLPALALAAAAGLFVYSLQFDPELEDLAGQRTRLATRSIATAPAHVDLPSLLADVQTLAAPAMQGRKVGTAGGDKARAYLLQRFSAIGLDPVGAQFEQRFQFTPRRGIRFWRPGFWQQREPVTGVNLLGRITGTQFPGQVLVITAHYDHLGVRDGQTYHGADDNASGVAALLALARHFRANPPRHTLVFAALDGEESGLQGARALLRDRPFAGDSILLNVNFDMLSRSDVNELVVSGLYANAHLKPLLDPLRATATPTVLYGFDHPRPFWNANDWTFQSDHGVFHEQGIPFLYLGVQDHDDYHRPSDTFGNVDQSFFASVANFAVVLVGAIDAADAAALAKVE